jgi:6-phosphogluconolactonase
MWLFFASALVCIVVQQHHNSAVVVAFRTTATATTKSYHPHEGLYGNHPTVPPSSCRSSLPSSISSTMLSMATTAPPARDVWVLPTEHDVATAVHTIVKEAAKVAIADRGHFALAIPGGSVLKILSSMDHTDNDDDDDDDWTSKMTVAYVNHKCVANDDRDRAIHAQARALFLDRWNVSDDQVIRLDDSSSRGDDDDESVDAIYIASDYQSKLEALSETVLPRHPTTGYPVFDLMLIGVGDDGHIGSLYPNQPHVNVNTAWTVGVVKAKGPSSISLSLPVMQHAKFSVVAAAGKSTKYPQGKATAMRYAIADGSMSPTTFPACALRETAIWILDEPNASQLNLDSDDGHTVVTVRSDINYRERS